MPSFEDSFKKSWKSRILKRPLSSSIVQSLPFKISTYFSLESPGFGMYGYPIRISHWLASCSYCLILPPIHGNEILDLK